MIARTLCAAAVAWCMLVGSSQADLHTFDAGDLAAGAPLTMSGPATFTSNYERTIGTIDFYAIPSNSTFSASVIAGNGVGAVTFTAERVLVAPTQVSLLLYDAAHQYGFLEFIFPAAGLPLYPNPIPSLGPLTNPPVPVSIWRNSALVDPLDNTSYLQGFRTGATLNVAGVPEPSAGLLLGLVTASCIAASRWKRSHCSRVETE